MLGQSGKRSRKKGREIENTVNVNSYPIFVQFRKISQINSLLLMAAKSSIFTPMWTKAELDFRQVFCIDYLKKYEKDYHRNTDSIYQFMH